MRELDEWVCWLGSHGDGLYFLSSSKRYDEKTGKRNKTEQRTRGRRSDKTPRHEKQGSSLTETGRMV